MTTKTTTITTNDKIAITDALDAGLTAGIITKTEHATGKQWLDEGYLPAVTLKDSKWMVIFTLDGARCDCGKGILCTENTQVVA